MPKKMKTQKSGSKRGGGGMKRPMSSPTRRGKPDMGGSRRRGGY